MTNLLQTQMNALETANRVVDVQYTALAWNPAYRVKHIVTYYASRITVSSSVEYYDDWQTWQGATLQFGRLDSEIVRGLGASRLADKVVIMNSEQLAAKVLNS